MDTYKAAVAEKALELDADMINDPSGLTIDPDLVFSTFVGGGLYDSITSVATDSSGNTYFGGWTESTDFPTLSGYQSTAVRPIDAFVAKVSHEFRTPLTLMLGPIEDAIAQPDRSLGGENLEVVHRNSLRLLKLVNTLLDFSRIEAGRVQALNPKTLLEDAYGPAASEATRTAVSRAESKKQGLALLFMSPEMQRR